MLASNPNPGLGVVASKLVLHSSGAVSKELQIALSREAESLPVCACIPFIIKVGEPAT